MLRTTEAFFTSVWEFVGPHVRAVTTKRNLSYVDPISFACRYLLICIEIFNNYVVGILNKTSY